MSDPSKPLKGYRVRCKGRGGPHGAGTWRLLLQEKAAGRTSDEGRDPDSPRHPQLERAKPPRTGTWLCPSCSWSEAVFCLDALAAQPQLRSQLPRVLCLGVRAWRSPPEPHEVGAHGSLRRGPSGEAAACPARGHAGALPRGEVLRGEGWEQQDAAPWRPAPAASFLAPAPRAWPRPASLRRRKQK